MTHNRTTTLLEAALRAAEHGWHVFPSAPPTSGPRSTVKPSAP